MSDFESVASELITLRDFLRYAISRFERAGLVYGHGTTNAIDEAAFLILEGLSLPIDQLDPFLDARLLRSERERLASLIEARVTTRKPASYLLGKAYVKGIPFEVDERVIVPRSFIGELLFSDVLIGPEGLIQEPDHYAHVLDLCTGSGCLAILAARVFPNAAIDAVDLSPEALVLAERNVGSAADGDRIALFQGNLFEPLKGRRYDLIITNPPYVSEAVMQSLPPEYAHEPRLALAGGEDGLDIVRQILHAAPHYLTPQGGLLCEIGEDRDILEEEFPELPFIWLDTEESSGEVFWLSAQDFPKRK
ncbi:MAG: 50S ribosomal protein L3 N(5)-glutamine methyltransferase [Alphaproteobacteria bacterium]|nr:50S ribosomal protein L3 N(5)-glutamine methyltransferase [Alphaproteobacteria bacterium]